MTTAEKISARLHDDGLRWRTEDDETLDDLCRAELGVVVAHGHGCTRYTFGDGSVITAADSGWDLGYPGCFCFDGAGSHPDCRGEGTDG